MKRFLLAAACAASLATPAISSTVSNYFSSFYSFGDSLTDDGKFGMLEAPSFGGRFTNGLTWSEYIEDDFAAAGKDNANFALGGATAGPINLNNPGPLATFDKQIAAFGAGLPFFTPGDDPLVSVWLGANDIFQGFDPLGAANSVADGIRAIANIGGSIFDDFLMIKLPSIPGAAGAAEAFNAELDQEIAGLRADGFRIITFDPANVTNAIIADFLNGSPIYGITDLVTPCAASLTDGDASSCIDDGIDPNTRLFVDPVHPNAVAHEITATQVNAAVLAAVPLPAGGVLLLGGLALLGGLRARKSR